MIQRIQTVFLLLAAVAFASLFMLPFASSNTATATLFEDKIFDISDNIILLIITGLGIIISIFTIFKYKNRSLQMRMGYINIILAIFLALVAGMLVMNEAGTIQIEDEAGMFSPFAALVFIILANVFIKKDDKIVKSSDRLR